MLSSFKSLIDFIGRSLTLVLVLTLLPGCSNLETHTLGIQTAATGTEIEARQLVALVYAQAPEAEIDKLPYSAYDLPRVIKRIRERYPQLKPWLDQGVIGNTASGFVALRDLSKAKDVADLLKAENNDRAYLYRQMSTSVGHGRANLLSWFPFASYTFGKEWTGQGLPGWWWLNEQQEWQQSPVR